MKNKIIEIIKKVNPAIETYTGENLIRDMEIDSHDIFNIIVDLEEAFDIEIPPTCLKANNFVSMDSIIDMIQKIKG